MYRLCFDLLGCGFYTARTLARGRRCLAKTLYFSQKRRGRVVAFTDYETLS